MVEAESWGHASSPSVETRSGSRAGAARMRPAPRSRRADAVRSNSESGSRRYPPRTPTGVKPLMPPRCRWSEAGRRSPLAGPPSQRARSSRRQIEVGAARSPDARGRRTLIVDRQRQRDRHLASRSVLSVVARDRQQRLLHRPGFAGARREAERVARHSEEQAVRELGSFRSMLGIQPPRPPGTAQELPQRGAEALGIDDAVACRILGSSSRTRAAIGSISYLNRSMRVTMRTSTATGRRPCRTGWRRGMDAVLSG